VTSRSKAKGSGAERAVVEHLRANGFPHAERRLAGATKDRGDIAGVPAVVIEVNNCERIALGAWVDEATLEQANDGADYGLVWHKRRGRADAGQWYATMPAAQMVRLLRQAGYGTPLSATQTDETARAQGPGSTSPPERPIPHPKLEAWNTTGGMP
jgi:hypothetical protein